MDECWLCVKEKIVITKTERFPCPACCIGKFLFYSEEKKTMYEKIKELLENIKKKNSQ